MMVLKVEDISRNSRWMLDFLLSRWVRAAWTTDDVASEMDLFLLLAYRC